MRIYNIIRKNINKAVEFSGRSRMQVAKDAEISYPNLCRFINGKRDGLGIDVLYKLARDLDVPMAFFFGEKVLDQKNLKYYDDLPEGFGALVEKVKLLNDTDKKRVKDVLSVLVDSYKQ